MRKFSDDNFNNIFKTITCLTFIQIIITSVHYLTRNISIGIILYYSSLNDLSLGYKVVFVRNTRSDDEEKSVGYSL